METGAYARSSCFGKAQERRALFFYVEKGSIGILFTNVFLVLNDGHFCLLGGG